MTLTSNNKVVLQRKGPNATMAEIFLEEKKSIKIFRVVCPKCGVYYAGYRKKPKPKRMPYTYINVIQCSRCKEAVDLTLKNQIDSYIRPPFYWTATGEIRGLISKWTLFTTDLEKVDGILQQEGTLEEKTYKTLLEINDFLAALSALSEDDGATIAIYAESYSRRAEALQEKVLELFSLSYDT